MAINIDSLQGQNRWDGEHSNRDETLEEEMGKNLIIAIYIVWGWCTCTTSILLHQRYSRGENLLQH